MKYIRQFLKFSLATMMLLALWVTQSIAKQNDSNVLLAHVYQRGIDVRQYLVSEKYDGVRAVWDGNKLHTRSGRVIAAPTWFTKNLPKTPLDGELWLGRGNFDALSGTVRKDLPNDEEWRGISYMIFELPNATGTFNERAKRIIEIVNHANIPQLKAVKQYRINDEATLNKQLKQMVAQGGEGLMLHRADAAYITGRSDVLLKVKLLLDAEATVKGHTPGRGKYADKLGALEVETPEGIRFKLGTGFTDAQRADPPKIGSTVTYTYRDITKTGKPKFASFLRVRNEK